MSYCTDKIKWGNLDFEVKFKLKSQDQSPPKTRLILTKVFYIYGPNLVILAWLDDKLLRGQASGYCIHGRADSRTEEHTDRRRQRQYPKAKTSLGLKTWSTLNEIICKPKTKIDSIKSIKKDGREIRDLTEVVWRNSSNFSSVFVRALAVIETVALINTFKHN